MAAKMKPCNSCGVNTELAYKGQRYEEIDVPSLGKDRDQGMLVHLYQGVCPGCGEQVVEMENIPTKR